MPHERHLGFNDLGLSPKLVEVVTKVGYTVPTPIQERAIPLVAEHQDVVGIAQTGTGKTLAFGLPMLQNISRRQGQGLVLVPTRELALQVHETLHKIGTFFGLRTAVLIGGAGFTPQVQSLRKKPHIIVATPGRLNDHVERKTVTFEQIRVVVLDEADRMLDIGFAPQIKRILNLLPKDRQTLLFSATMPQEIAELAATYLKHPLRVEVAPAGTASEKVEQTTYLVPKTAKAALLESILTDQVGSVLVFTRTKFGAKKLTAQLIRKGFTAAEIHSNRSLGQRRRALDGFKSGEYRVLVATDIAARGIDVKGIALVVNYDLPDNPEDYVHRIGRTGRAGHHGHAITFVGEDERSDLKAIERLIKKQLPQLPLPPHVSVPKAEKSLGIAESPFPDRYRGDRRSRRGGPGRRRR